MVSVADASIAIRGDLTGFHRDLTGAERATQGFAGRIKNILSPRNVAAGAGLFGIGLGARALIDFAGDAAGAFAELEQTVRTIDDVFGESADTIHEWGETAAETAGMSQQTFMSSAAIMGQTLQNMGFEIQESADLTVQLLQRAADMALAFGKRPQDALLAITAAMRGERDTIEKFGVAIKQVDVNAKIAALGLDTSTASAKKFAEAAAVVELVLEQSQEQAGRFASSQDDIAAKMAVVNAKWEDFIALEVGPAVASIQLGAIKAGEAVGGFFDTAGNNIDGFALNFGHQRVQIHETAEQIGMDFTDLKDRIVALMADGMDFEVALDIAADPEAAARAGLIMTVGVGDAIAQGAAENVNPAVTDMMTGAGDMIAASAPEIIDAASIIAEIPVSEFNARKEAARGAGAATVIEYAAGLLTPQTELETAIQTALQVVEDEMSITEELAYLSGQKVVLEEARGIAVQEGKDAAVLAIDGALSLIEDRMILLANKAYDYGLNTSTSYAAGLNAGYGFVVDAAGNLAAATRNQIGINSEPKDHSSPLYGITKWGGNIVKTIASGIYGELGTGSAAAGALAGALVPAFGGSAMAGSVSTPSVGVGNTYHVSVNDLPQHPTLAEIGGELKRLGDMGKLPGAKRE